MKEINIAKAIVSKRKEKGITQDELAAISAFQRLLFQNGKPGKAIPTLPFFLS